MPSPRLLLATVCLERNRWGSRQPSFRVSEWLPRITADGFEGIELWEYHYRDADEAERARLRQAAPIAVFNTYAGFTDDPADLASRALAAEAATQLQARGIKYNIGSDATRRSEYRRNLLAWADTLPAECRLLCECHPGTLLEDLDEAVPFFDGLDPDRFPVIAHVNGDAETLDRWVDAWGGRLRHLHIQLREPEQATPEGRARLAACVRVLREARYDGTASIEFTRGIGKTEQIETIYANAVADADAFREAWK